MSVPLNIGLNMCVQALTYRMFPQGFDVSGVTPGVDEAPDTLRGLNAQLKNGGRMVVYGGHSDKTIFGSPEVNWCSRAWHAWCHWRGQHEFTREGEFAVWKMQCDHILDHYGYGGKAALWTEILYAETLGQIDYETAHGVFPDDQMGFVKEYLKSPTDALNNKSYINAPVKHKQVA